jgi:hypothetical protein
MSGVSIDSGGSNLDVATILNGGADFLKRLEQWQAAKAEHDAALANLGIGQDAVAARDEAARQLDAAKAKAAEIEAQSLSDATEKQRKLNDFIASATQETTRAVEAARANEAATAAKLAAADEAHKAAAKANAEAQDLLAKHRAAAEAVQKAQAALANTL